MTSSPPAVAGVDSSTQSTKVEIRRTDTGERVGFGRAPHPPVTPPEAEQDPQAWWHAFEDAFAQALDDAGRHGVESIAAISVAAQQHGCVIADQDGEVIRPAKLWNDTTTAPDAAWLVEQLPAGRAGWAQACGSVPVAAFTIAKLSWLHRSEPENWARLARVCLPHDWLTSRLTGRFVTDRGDASGTGYWSPGDERYRFDLLGIVDDALPWGEMVPDVLGPIDPAGDWSGAIVGPGTGDNMAAALGIGLTPGDIAISVGTSGTVYTVSEAPTADPSGAVAGFADATGRYLPLVCTLNAAKVTDTIARLLDVGPDEFAELALSAPSGSGDLTVLPYFDGERTPDLPEATGMISGLTTGTNREQLAVAAVQGVVCGLLDGVDELEKHARLDGGTVYLVGGGAKSAAYRQILADVMGAPVTTSDVEEAVATGACVQAAAVLEQSDPGDVRSRWSIGRETVTEPRPTDREAIRSRYAQLRELSGGPPAPSDTDGDRR